MYYVQENFFADNPIPVLKSRNGEESSTQSSELGRIIRRGRTLVSQAAYMAAVALPNQLLCGESIKIKKYK